jgi:hypothetical protein
MGIPKAIALPDGRDHSGDPIARRAPQMIEIMGQPTLIVHCSSMITGLCADNAESGMKYDGQLMVTCCTPGDLGLMYLMNIEQARNFAHGMLGLCDKQEAAAKDAATAALQKAGAK